MADTFTTDGVGLILMGIGGDNNTWGTNLNNSALQIIADALSNSLLTTASAGALGPGNTLDLSANPPPAASSQAHYNKLAFAGTITANQTVIVPNLQKWWWVFNNTSGAFTVTMQLPGGVSPIVIPQTGGGFLVGCNGVGGLALNTLGTNNLIPGDGATSLPAYAFVNEQNSGWRRAGTQDLRLVIGGADVLQVTGAGAASPSVLNILAPESLQLAGSSFGGFTTGDVKLTFKTAADPGWVLMDDSTLGDASSNATHASAANSALFQLLYNNISDADAPILTSGGAATTRGAQGSAASAFANHCRLTLPLTLGRALAAAGSGAGLTARTLGHALGEEAHTLVTGEMPSHSHTFTGTAVTPTFSGNSVTPTGTFSGNSVTPTGTFTGTAGTPTGSFNGTAGTPTGTFSGTAVTPTGTFSGTAVTPTFSGTAATPTGTFSGTAATPTGTFSGTAGTATTTQNLPTNLDADVSLVGGTANAVFLPTNHGANVHVTYGTINSSFTPAGTIAINSLTPAGTITINSLTPAGTISQITPAGSITINSLTPAGTLAMDAFTPAGTISINSFTPAGTISLNSLTPAGSITINAITPSGSISSLTPSGTIGNTGGGTAHNVMQPSVFLNVMIKL
jgi:microcystin-dependent protein